MLLIDWNQPQPDTEEWLVKLYKELKISRRSINNAAVTAVLDQINRTHGNGGAMFASFDISPHPVLDWYGSRSLFDEIDFVDQFVRSPFTASAWPEMLDRNKITERVVERKIGGRSSHLLNPFEFADDLAQLLYIGGAYTKTPESAEAAKQLSKGFCNALFGSRYNEVWLCDSQAAWTTWFHGIAWDRTWFCVDKRQYTVWILCVTDTH